MLTAILDPFSGIAGDMTLGALLGVGLDPEWLRELPTRLGLALGILVAIGVRTAWPSIPASTSWGSVAAALVISAITGVIFGMLPAVRAARLDPVIALRYE